MASNMPKRVSEQRREIVSRIVSDMETKDLGWTAELARHALPHNPLTGTVYRGGNRLILTVTSLCKGYDDPRWVTLRQADERGWGKLRKGAESAAIEKWKKRRIVVENEDGEKESRTFMSCVGYWSVFNASEFEGAPEMECPPAPADAEMMGLVGLLLASSRCPVAEKPAECASYSPLADRITMPPRRHFVSLEAFARTLLHEMGHSTGHASALDRQLLNGFGTEDYAFEELVAELGAVFSGAGLGLELGADTETEHYARHVSYLKSWVSRLSDDPDYLFKAASAASDASDYILGR